MELGSTWKPSWRSKNEFIQQYCKFFHYCFRIYQKPGFGSDAWIRIRFTKKRDPDSVNMTESLDPNLVSVNMDPNK
jgi:hypothetical protein